MFRHASTASAPKTTTALFHHTSQTVIPMSKTGRRSASDDDRPRYPAIAKRIGEDPARYLADPNETTYAVIRGITDETRLDCWFAVEEDLGPREDVLAALNDRRKAILEEIQ